MVGLSKYSLLRIDAPLPVCEHDDKEKTRHPHNNDGEQKQAHGRIPPPPVVIAFEWKIADHVVDAINLFTIVKLQYAWWCML